jgi:hypothetical protein
MDVFSQKKVDLEIRGKRKGNDFVEKVTPFLFLYMMYILEKSKVFF